MPAMKTHSIFRPLNMNSVKNTLKSHIPATHRIFLAAIAVVLASFIFLPRTTMAAACPAQEPNCTPTSTTGGINTPTTSSTASSGLAPGCYTNNGGATNLGSNDTSSGTNYTQQSSCPATDAYNDPISSSGCYVKETNGYVPTSCVTLACLDGAAAASQVDCSPADSCNPADATATNSDGTSCPTGTCLTGGDNALCNSIVQDYVNPVLLFLGGAVGLVIVVMVVVGGIQYASSGGDPNKVAGAKSRIANALFALVAFGLVWAFLEWIVPGGVFG